MSNHDKESKPQFNEAPESSSRREFLSGAAALAVVGVAGSVAPRGALAGDAMDELPGNGLASGENLRALSGEQRQTQVLSLRRAVAELYRSAPLADNRSNGDEQRYPNYIGNYSKGMPHNGLGEVDAAVYATYLRAIETGDRESFDQIATPGDITLRNIENIWSIDYLGPDSHQMYLKPAPAFASAEQAGEFAELYWQSITRDVPFSQYASDPKVAAAAADLSAMSDFRGPKVAGEITPETLFRGGLPGDLNGPFISQFLAMDIPYGALLVPQRILTSPAGTDYVTAYDDWLRQQNGFVQTKKLVDPVHRYIRSGRDMGEYVGRDFAYQPYLNAALILTRSLKAPYDPSNPYIKPGKPSQHGHNTFGAHHVYHLVVRIANIAQRHAWYHKWGVQRRLRPEAFGGRVHNHVVGATNYPLHRDLLDSAALQETYSRQGTYMLAQQYPEGVPPHPAYPAGHATIAGACVTMLKAAMNEEWEIPSPVVANAEGTALESYVGGPLTVGGELNKLASNIAIGRDTAGVHWRSDSIQGMFLGEAIALDVLRDLRFGYYEQFAGFTVTKFDGTKVTV